jgi:hypothetical protein
MIGRNIVEDKSYAGEMATSGAFPTGSGNPRALVRHGPYGDFKIHLSAEPMVAVRGDSRVRLRGPRAK